MKPLGGGIMQMELPTRKNNRLLGYDYSSAGYYFVTLCVKDKRKLLGNVVGDAVLSVPIVELSDTGEIVKSFLTKMNYILDYATLMNYVIMPNQMDSRKWERRDRNILFEKPSF